VKPFQCDGQRIGAVCDPLALPGNHLSVLPHRVQEVVGATRRRQAFTTWPFVAKPSTS
jgi:hypothetical protein